jgi:flagellar biosynthesis protein FliR
MPQLDTTTFISQIFFTFFIFMFLYINVIKWIIPYIHSFLTTKLKKTFNVFIQNDSSKIIPFDPIGGAIFID